MAMRTIDRVREAELKANADRQSAESKAQSIIDEARKKGEDIVAQAKADAEALMHSVEEASTVKANELIAERRRAAQESADALREKTLSLKQNVINKLVEETLV